jgi:HKD family nuclease
MAKREFILQGFTSRTHAVAVRELFEIPDIERVIISAAFITESGVQQIEAQIAATAKVTTIFAGIRNDITSHQGLNRLIQTGCTLYTVDTGSRGILFHPKLYQVRAKAEARLILGSANLTLGGLNNNIEAGMKFDLDFEEAADRALVDSIEKQLDALPAEYPEHVVQVKDEAALDNLLAAGLLIDETALPPPKPTTTAKAGAKQGAIARIKLKVAPIFRKFVKTPGAPKKPAAAPAAGAAVAAPPSIPAIGVEYEIVWQSKLLTRRDLTIPEAAGTHATGSVNLDKGLMPAEVDHRHYFREQVFPALNWQPATNTTEQAFAKFHLVIQGVSHGEFDLRIGHTVGTDSEGYKQNNAMTRLSWRPMREFIAHKEFIGLTLSLYRDKADATRFLLEID